jgi:hypothetical protein
MRTTHLAAALVLSTFFLATARADSPDALAAGWDDPPQQAKLRAYWWWLDGNVDNAAITANLEYMKKVGMGGGLVCDAGGPAGPTGNQHHAAVGVEPGRAAGQAGAGLQKNHVL